MNAPAVRVIALSNINSDDAPDDVIRMRPDLLVEVTMLGFVPDGDEATAVVCLTAEDEQDSISWMTQMPHKEFVQLVKMRELVNQPSDISSLDLDKSPWTKSTQGESENHKKREGIAKSGVAIANLWKRKRIQSLKEVELTIKYLKEAANFLPEIWKKEALEIAEELDNKFFTLRRLRKSVELFCSFSAEVISTA
jgi:hypothetical protein